MTLRRSVGFFKGMSYRGNGPMLSWVLHRIGGLGMIIFVSMHVVASFLMHVVNSPSASQVGTTINKIYESLYFQIFIFFFVIFHVLNGLRILILDTWPKLLEFQREATWLQYLIFIPIYGLTIFLMIMRQLGGG
jgi:succinate dehydrogenase / fumarate reductase cytochrome b subunit